MELEKNILIFGNIDKSNILLDELKENANPKYKLFLTTINSLKDLFSSIKNDNIDLLCILDTLIDINQEELILSIYKEKSINKFYTIFINELNTINKLEQLMISPNSICIKSKSSFIYERLYFYESIEKLFLEDYFSGNLGDYNIFEIFLLLTKLKKTGVLSIKSNDDKFYFDLYFKEGNLVSSNGYNGYIFLYKIDCIKEIFKDINYKNSYFEFLSDIAIPDIHFNIGTMEIISNIYKSFKLNLDKSKNEYFISQEDIKNSIISTSNNKDSIRKTIIITSNIKENIKETIIINNDKENESNFIENRGVKMANSVDLNKAVEIAEDIYWVGDRDPKSLLQVNPYLRIFKKGSKIINFMVDPGPIKHFPTISKKVSSIIKDISKINMYSLNHQDPDVGMNATFLSKINPKSACLCTEDTWNLAQFYDIPKTNYKNVYSFENKSVTISTDSSHVIQFVPTPYCHFVGAVAVYDKKTRILFSGDLFGGISPINNLDLFATEEHWDGIKALHQIYLPSKRAIQNAIDNIRALDEPPLMIVPHHGAILVGEIMELFMNRLYHLDVGADLFDKKEEKLIIPIYLDLMNRIFVKFSENVDINILNNIFNFNDKNQELFHFIDIDSNGIKNIFSNPERALYLLLKMISTFEDDGIVNEIKSFAISEALTRGLPMPLDIYDINNSFNNENNPNLFEGINEGKEEDLFV